MFEDEIKRPRSAIYANENLEKDVQPTQTRAKVVMKELGVFKEQTDVSEGSSVETKGRVGSV